MIPPMGAAILRTVLRRTIFRLGCVMDIKLIVADNHAVYRTGFARFMTVEDGVRIIGQCDDLSRLYKATESARSAVIAFASSLSPDLDRLVVAAKSGGNRLLAILECGESPQPMLSRGIPGMLYRDVSREDVVQCVRQLALGRSFQQQLPASSTARFETDIVAERVRGRLTQKELQVVRLLIRGYRNKDIARELNNTEQVIKNYLRSIFDKTGVSDRLELALFTIHHKLLLDAVETVAPSASASLSRDDDATTLVGGIQALQVQRVTAVPQVM